MTNLFQVSFNAVLQLVLIALVGVWLARKNILTPVAKRTLAQIILWVMLPSLLITSLSREADMKSVSLYFGIMLAAPIFVLLGAVIGNLLATAFKVPGDLWRVTVAASTYGNSSYIPLPFMAVICLTAPFIHHSPELAKNDSITYISLYLLCYSPLLWLTGFPYLSGKGYKQIRLRQLVNPPLLASVIGVCIAFIPTVRNMFHAPDAPFAVVTETMDLLAQGVFPCALLVLGANLVAPKEPASRLGRRHRPLHIPFQAYLTVVLGKLVIMPIIGLAYVVLAWKNGFIPHDPLVALVILIESAVPPANNLIIMCQTHDKGEMHMARLLFVAYCISILTLTVWTVVFLKLIMRWS